MENESSEKCARAFYQLYLTFETANNVARVVLVLAAGPGTEFVHAALRFGFGKRTLGNIERALQLDFVQEWLIARGEVRCWHGIRFRLT